MTMIVIMIIIIMIIKIIRGKMQHDFYFAKECDRCRHLPPPPHTHTHTHTATVMSVWCCLSSSWNFLWSGCSVIDRSFHFQGFLQDFTSHPLLLLLLLPDILFFCWNFLGWNEGDEIFFHVFVNDSLFKKKWKTRSGFLVISKLNSLFIIFPPPSLFSFC